MAMMIKPLSSANTYIKSTVKYAMILEPVILQWLFNKSTARTVLSLSHISIKQCVSFTTCMFLVKNDKQKIPRKTKSGPRSVFRLTLKTIFRFLDFQKVRAGFRCNLCSEGVKPTLQRNFIPCLRRWKRSM